MVKMSHRYVEAPLETAIHQRARERESDNRQLSVSPTSSRASTPSSVLSDRTSFSTARTTPEPMVPEPQKQIPISKISTPTPPMFFCADDIDDMSLELSKSPALQAAMRPVLLPSRPAASNSASHNSSDHFASATIRSEDTRSSFAPSFSR